MKCPKCGYLGFEPVDRCRNCGYDFSLANAASGATDLPELAIRDEAHARSEDPQLLDLTIDPGPGLQSRPPAVRDEPAARSPEAPGRRGDELPLFELRQVEAGPGRFADRPVADDEPLIKKAPAPRPPLSVRRATPDVSRSRAEARRMPSLDLGLDIAPPAASRGGEAEGPAREEPWPPRVEAGTQEPASLFARLCAAVVDVGVLVVVDILVIYFTMQLCEIQIGELGLLPKGPLLAFLIVQNGGYLTAFTASGQTLGKMAAGIRVVAMPGTTLDLGRAAIRTIVWLMLVLPAGLGLLSAVFSADHRGLHDRLASTRVVRASV